MLNILSTVNHIKNTEFIYFKQICKNAAFLLRELRFRKNIKEILMFYMKLMLLIIFAQQTIDVLK